jgi:GrxC family glutaredoxin
MSEIEIYTKRWCPYCVWAKALLNAKGVTYREIRIGFDPSRKREMIERSQRRTVPQVFINSESIGGYDELAGLDAAGGLDRLLGIASET